VIREWLGSVRWRKLAPIGILACGILAYANTFSSPFIFDDYKVIVTSPKVRHYSAPWRDVYQPCRWLTDLTFAINHAVGGFNVADYHATNLLIHLGAGLLLYGVIRRSLQTSRLTARYGNEATGLAAVAATVWVVHPLQTESVTYLSQRYESLMGLFYLLSLYLVVRGYQSPRPKAWYGAAVLSCALGMGTKEVMVTAPAMVFLYDRVFLSRSLLRSLRERWGLYAGLALTWVVLGYLYWLGIASLRDRGGAIMYSDLTPWGYALSQFGVIARYLRLAVLPSGLCLDYCLAPPKTLMEILPPLIGVGGLVVATLLSFRRHPELAFLGVWFFAILAPTSSIIPVSDLIFEHRVYLSLASLCVLGVIAAREGLKRLSVHFAGAAGFWRTAAPAGLAIGVILTLVGLTFSRNRDYRSEEVMWRDVIRKRPDNLRVYIGLSHDLIQQNRCQEAAAYCRRVLAKIAGIPKVPISGMSDFQKSGFEHDIYFASLIYGQAHNNLGIALLREGKGDEALRHYREAVRILPRYPSARNNLAYALYRAGRTNEAVESWLTTLEFAPDNPTAHCFLGMVMAEQNRPREAVEHYEAALRSKPDFVLVQQQLAWLLATHWEKDLRNGRRAVELALAVCTATDFRGPRALDSLAAAYAEVGRFADATAVSKRAIELARGVQQRNLPSPEDASSMTGRGEDVVAPEPPPASLRTCEKIGGRGDRVPPSDENMRFVEHFGGSAPARQGPGAGGSPTTASGIKQPIFSHVLTESGSIPEMEARLRLYERGLPFHRPPPGP
jgi:tetratricopeptide (TPR) repeat protein